ncbi:MAG: ArsR family transcriptional regulator [Methanosarcinaceae archaeon]|nr:ArsR family transcriptional regulator [Methanosarcinaceae archaeon]
MTKKDSSIFKAIGSTTRLSMLEKLAEGEMHISGLARELNISVPVAAKHINILEDANLIERKVFGKTHILKIIPKNIYNAMDSFALDKKIEVERGSSLLDALKSVSAVEIKKVGNREVVVSTDGEEGFYVYEIGGKFSEKTVQECVFDDDVTVEWKKLLPVTKMRLEITVKK